eukprot:3040021-Ditylum_brightwellii.AAC.1
MAKDDTEEDTDENNVPELQAHTNNDNDDNEYDSSDDKDSIYDPEEDNDESVTETDADIAGVYKDNTTGVATQTEESQDNNSKSDLQFEAYNPEPHITGFIAPNGKEKTPDKSNIPATYDSELCHENEYNNETPLITETSKGNKKVKIKMPATIIKQ